MSTVAYEPTRGIGHAMGQYFGITPGPAVSVTEAVADDVILVASDGLWNVLGQVSFPSIVVLFCLCSRSLLPLMAFGMSSVSAALRVIPAKTRRGWGETC
jgi:hypothetical protein